MRGTLSSSLLRAVRDGRYILDPSLARPQDGPRRARFAFAFSRDAITVTVRLREGFVTDEFLQMLATPDHTPEQAQRFVELKDELAERVMAAEPDDVYDVSVRD